jgi:D-tyrosyl-tRNA(Tyr) deacylase
VRAVVQRVKQAEVRVGGGLVGSISRGLLVYLGVGQDDDETHLRYLADKIVNLRIFEDEEGRMNRSLPETGGELLVVSQFTLWGDARKGRRPSYSRAADPQRAESLYLQFIEECKKAGLTVRSGEFGAMMDVSYTNYGPVTILLDSEKLF